MNRRTVMVTGGAGFIGSELVRQLAQNGHTVKVVDNLINGKSNNIEDVVSDRVNLYVDDIRDTSRMKEVMIDVDIVFHLACLGVRHSIHSPYENHEVNATATLNLLKIAKDKSINRFVYVSSSEVYGTALSVPMTEEHPTFPMTVYGASKLAGECYTRAYHRTYGCPIVVVRPFNSYGPRCHHEGDSGEVIPKFMLRTMAGKPMVIFGDGTQTRDFTFVSDTARGIIAAGLSEHAIGQTVNLGYGQEILINDLAKEVGRVLGQEKAEVIHEKNRPGDVIRLFADTTKAEELLQFKPAVSLGDGLSLLKEWYLEKDQSPEDLLENEKVLNWERS